MNISKNQKSSLEDASSKVHDSQRLWAAKVSLIIGSAIMLLKFFAFKLTSSEAILSDALESIANVVAALMVVITIMYTAKPADKDHPYGHGKIEYFSAAFEGGLVSFAALFIMVESITALIYGHMVHNIGSGVVIVIIAGLSNLALGGYLVRSGKRLQSIALESSGKHVLSDVWTSVGLLLGLAIVHWTGWVWLDAVIAFFFGLYLAFVGYEIVTEAAGGLMDKEDPEVLQDIAAALKPHSMNGIIDIHEMKVIRSGRYHHIDMHVVLPGHWTVEQVHERVKVFEQAAIDDYVVDGEMHFHYDPCRQDFCAVCDLKDCKLRQEEYQPEEPVPVQIRQSQSEEVVDPKARL